MAKSPYVPDRLPTPGRTHDTVRSTGNEKEENTGNHMLQSLPPDSISRKWTASVERRLEQILEVQTKNSNGNGHLKKTKELVDWIKWAVLLVAGVAGIGWFAHEFISGFQTKEDARTAQATNDNAHTSIQATLEAQDEQLRVQRESSIRMELQQQNTNDRLRQVLILGQAESRAERREAQAQSDALEEHINNRTQVLESRRAFDRFTAKYNEDPVQALNSL